MSCDRCGQARSAIPAERPWRPLLIQSLEPPLEDYQRLRVGPYRVIFRNASDHVRCVFAERRGIVYEVFAEMVERP